MRSFVQTFYFGVLLLWVIALTPAHAQSNIQPAGLQGVGITEHLDKKIDTKGFRFKDESGKAVRLADYFHSDHPVLLALIYYECPNLCNLLMNGLVKALQQMDWNPGEKFEIVAITINPKENSEVARLKKENYLKAYGRPQTREGWHFLTSEDNQVQKLANEIGFSYRFDENQKQYAHTSALFIFTPQAKISRYLYGISFIPQNLRLALLEASQGKIGGVVDQVLLFCFHYDPDKNSYSFRVWKLVTLILCCQVIFMGGWLWKLWRKDNKIRWKIKPRKNHSSLS